MVLSSLPFNYDSFSTNNAEGNSEILFIELFISDIECVGECSMLTSATDAISLVDSLFSDIFFREEGSVLSFSISQPVSLTYLNTTLLNVNASHTTSLFSFTMTGVQFPASITFVSFLVSDTILNDKLFYVSGTSLSFHIASFAISNLSYEEANPTALEGLFHLDSLGAFVMSNTII